MGIKFVKVVTAIGLSSLKHTLGGVPLAAGYGFSYLEVVLYTSIGGVIGVAAFIFLSQAFQNFVHKNFRKRQKKRVFTRKKRLIVRIKRTFGLPGLAFVTPWLLSVPVGTMITYSIYRDKKKVFLAQSASVIFWSVVGGALAQPIAQLLHA